MGEWYYIGHYGQLGPLTKDQVDELIQGGVIVRETYVWRVGMTDWVPASAAGDLASSFRIMQPAGPPPPPIGQVQPSALPPSYGTDYATAPPVSITHTSYHPRVSSVKSDRSRTAAGILQLVVPGVGRIYMGYAAIGVLQLVLTVCGGIGWIWSVIDGIVILGGGVKMDGYGRQMND
ncbi:MAG TPA: GYF domain-containing protein [Fimbriimonas sp.]|nr:GYF domain-containing protein [Fimbriimonas sp.]